MTPTSPQCISNWKQQTYLTFSSLGKASIFIFLHVIFSDYFHTLMIVYQNGTVGLLLLDDQQSLVWSQGHSGVFLPSYSDSISVLSRHSVWGLACRTLSMILLCSQLQVNAQDMFLFSRACRSILPCFVLFVCFLPLVTIGFHQ